MSADQSVGGARADYERIARAIEYLVVHAHEQPSLGELAAHLGIGQHHTQRLFKRWAGVSPKRFVQGLTLERAKALLAGNAALLETSLSLGLSGPSRLHDLFVTVEGMTPAEYRGRGRDLVVRWGLCDSPYGVCLVASTPRGVCDLRFVDQERRDLAEFRDEWSLARLLRDDASARAVAEQIFSGAPGDLLVHLRGTNFQLQVWRALLRVPEGQVIPYEGLAAAVGHPTATRAVASAVAKNPVSFVVPCHRVIRKSGAVGNYRWGPERKRLMLTRESLQAESS